ncbi:MAG TPA: transglycosylase SLT domain-containing protein [Thermodesulfobacteriota bacterium]|nr:transglycosylase SLT domain-containing protein [Thermodesulfobacteriota bacterium]HNU70381.1 transglycosylase SLT domain-containing protein [Thermodesulfobacteriota bacterium]
MTDKYDPLFQLQGEKLGIDCRFFKAMAYVESSFNALAKSRCGALGLMQIMPATAKDCGIAIGVLLYNPLINVAIGTTYLVDQYRQISEIKSHNERLKVALAAYNGGLGYVLKAIRIFERSHGYTPTCWNDVKVGLQSPDCLVRGEDPECGQIFAYVEKVWKTYQAYLTQEGART